MEYILIFISGAIIGFVIGKGPSNKVNTTDACNQEAAMDTTPCLAQAHSVYRINGAKYCKDCGDRL